jgi:hypothetical protein
MLCAMNILFATLHLAAGLKDAPADTVQSAHDAGSSSLTGLVGIVLGALSFLISISLGMFQLGVFNRPRHLIVGERHQDADGTVRFALRFENQGNTPISFQSFEILHPRLDAVKDGAFVLSDDGAEVYENGTLRGHEPSRQEFSRIERSLRKVGLQPHAGRTEFFETEARAGVLPVLVFRDSFGNRFHCEDALASGRYVYPHRLAYLAALGVDAGDVGVKTERSLWRRWSHEQSRFETA